MAKRKLATAAPSFMPDDDVLQEYLCPITSELPIEPCYAKDGHVYDQWALEKWMDTKKDGEIKSPMTNQPMGKELVPAHQVRSAIHRLIDKGIIAGENAQKWKAWQKELDAMEKGMRATMGRAQKGELRAMRLLAFAYWNATHGIEKNLTKAVEWFDLPAKADDPHSVVSLGIFYLNGNVVQKDAAKGMVYVTRAAMLGSEHACIVLGNKFSDPVPGQIIHQDNEQATYWYRKSLKCKHDDSLPEPRAKRDKWLSENAGEGYGRSDA